MSEQEAKAHKKNQQALRRGALAIFCVVVSDEILSLARKYMEQKVVGETSFDDCVHIATATINKVDILVSWNFKHIVNVYRIRGYNSINIRSNYAPLEIRSPKEILEYEDGE